MTLPRWDSVAALYALTNSMMLTPCWPRAGPTGGAGVACPAGVCSFTVVMTFFAMVPLPSLVRRPRRGLPQAPRGLRGAVVRGQRTSVEALDLVERQVHGDAALEDRDGHL